MTTEKQFENQFNKVKKLAGQHQTEGAKLDRLIDKKYGFSYSDMDLDEIIDVDYP